MLGFGQISWYLGYNALADFFPSMMIKPNPNCSDHFCLKQQEAFKNRIIDEPINIVEDLPKEQVTHDDNTWGWSFTVINFEFLL